MRNMTKRRRYLISSEKESRVPEEYQEVAWLRGNGTQWCYLPTGYGIGLDSENHFHGIKGDLELLTATQYSIIVISCDSGRASQAVQYKLWQIRGTNGSLSEGYYPPRSSGINNILLSDNSSLVYHFEINKNSMTINNSILSSPNFPLGSYCDQRIRIGARQGTNDATVIEDTNALIKSIKLTYDDNIICEFIPCYRVADNKAGLFYWIDYEQGTNGFITNMGTGSDWLIGPDV